MERRIEPRFQVSSKIRVIVPEYPARILDCNLSDVSATGIRFMSPERLNAEDIVAVEVDLRLILAEVRYCESRNGRFAIGVRRLHEIEKFDQLSDPVACVREIMWDLHRHISAADEADPARLAMKALEKIVQRDGTAEVEPPPVAVPVSEPPAPEPVEIVEAVPVESSSDATEVEPRAPAVPVSEALEAEPVEVVDAIPVESSADATEVKPPALSAVPASEAPEAEPVEMVEAISVESSDATELPDLPEEIIDALPQPEPVAAAGEIDIRAIEPESETPSEFAPTAPELATESAAIEEVIAEATASTASDEPEQTELESRATESPAEPVEMPEGSEPAADASETGDLLDQMRSAHARELAEVPAPKPKKSLRLPLSIAAGLILALAVAFTWIEKRSQASVPNSPVAIEKSPSQVAAPAPIPAASPTADAAPPPENPAKPAENSAAPAVHHAEIAITGTSWVSIASDGGKALQVVLHQGDNRSIDFSKEVLLWFGDGSAAKIMLDGKSIAPLKAGVRVLQLTPDGVKFLKAPPSEN